MLRKKLLTCAFYIAGILDIYATDHLPTLTYHFPEVNEDSIQKKTYCIRPSYKDDFDLSQTEVDQKKVMTISGLGGAGYTIGLGVVNHQINQFEKEVVSTLPQGRETEIAIIGNGLASKLVQNELLTRGYKNFIVYDGERAPLPVFTASYGAGGYIAGNSKSKNNQQIEFYDDLCVETFKSYVNALKGVHKFLKVDERVIQRIPVFRSEPSLALSNYVKHDLMMEGEYVNLKIADTGIIHRLYCYKNAMYVNPSLLLEALQKNLDKHNITYLPRQVKNLSEVSSRMIFVCAGSLSGELNGHSNDYQPIIGHSILLNLPIPQGNVLSAHNSMVVLSGDRFQGKLTNPINTSINLFPKIGEGYTTYVGGTFIPTTNLNKQGYIQNESSYEGIYEHLLNNVRQFFGNKLAGY